jgi:hypothetical protein
MNPNSWLLEGHVARLVLPGVSLAFDADHPADGLAKIVVLDRPWSRGRLLGITGSIQSAAPTALADWHVRGVDLIAAYETGQPDAARVDLLWHAARAAPGDPWLARIDLLVSVRSERLEWRHDVRLESVLPGVTMVEKFAASVNVFRETTRGWLLAVMVPPADVDRQELTADGETSATCHLRQQLFPTESLERGVVLRARARAWFLPLGVDRAAVAVCFAEFAAADPPLGS